MFFKREGSEQWLGFRWSNRFLLLLLLRHRPFWMRNPLHPLTLFVATAPILLVFMMFVHFKNERRFCILVLFYADRDGWMMRGGG